MKAKTYSGRWVKSKSALSYNFKPPKSISKEMQGYFYTGPTAHFGHVTKPKKG